MVTCVGGKDSIVVSPIIHWLDVDVWRFLNEVVRVPHCELYDQGKHRLGCIMCPMSSLRQIRRDIKEYPYVYEKWVKAIMDIRKEAMLSDTPPERHNIQRRASNPIPRTPTSYVGGGWNRESRIGAERYQSAELPPEQSEPLVRQRKPRKMVPNQPNNYWYGKDSSKFSDCANGQCSTIGAYNEQEEREIAENIIDWWISKKSYRQWYAEKFLQQKLDLFDDEE